MITSFNPNLYNTMLIHAITPPFSLDISKSFRTHKRNVYTSSTKTSTTSSLTTSHSIFRAIRNKRAACLTIATSLFAAYAVLATAYAGALEAAPQDPETLSNVPQTLSGECVLNSDCKKARIQRPKSRKAEKCTSKCVTTCILGGNGSPGEGPLNIRRPIIVFKEGFRSRRYCLVECSDICNLIGDGDDGP